MTFNSIARVPPLSPLKAALLSRAYVMSVTVLHIIVSGAGLQSGAPVLKSSESEDAYRSDVDFRSTWQECVLMISHTSVRSPRRSASAA